MTAPRKIPDSVRLKQAQASDPAVSAFVTANAGAGKTHVLADRVIRLLLSGTDPAKILCITFTKAAAANMATRVFDRLQQWVALDDDDLDRAIGAIGAGKPDAATRAFARRLFARALETPGGLKVQTIHALCTRLLQQFPFEANVAARFAVLDDRMERQLLERAILGSLLDAAGNPNSKEGRALTAIVPTAADNTFREVVREAVGERDLITAWIDAAGGLDAAIAQLSRVLGIDPYDTMQRVEAAFFEGSHFDATEWPALAAIFAAGSKTDQEHVKRIEALRNTTGRERIEVYLKIFCTEKSTRREKIVTKKIADAHPELLQRLVAEQARVCALIDRRRAIAARDRSAALIAIASDVIARYRTEKERRGLLDYDDLIDKTLAMLTTVAPTWVHYKLDLGVEHVLIDEAQDTSPKQWRIIRQLVTDFAAGAGARPERHRTLFAVGDEKQSIFSFQGAAPRQFDEMRRSFATAFRAAELEWRDLRLEHSFRSGVNVLAGVEAVFARQDIFRSVTTDTAGLPPHLALPDAAPGVIELWDLCEPDDRPDVEPWRAPLDAVSETSPQVRLADKIAAAVGALCNNGRRAGDVLILVRQRGALFNHIIRALKNAGIAVAGADRLILTEHIAIEDLLALADALLLRSDDLALAVALKSPLFGLSEDQLFALAFGRDGTLRDALRAKAAQDEIFSAAQARLARCDAQVQALSPFAFFSWLLGAERGRAKILARLGLEAADPLDEFLQALLDFERSETPTLQGFVNWLRAADTEIKRDMEMTRDEVRVMTVHGAKGLEAPIVILADTTTNPKGPRHPRLLSLPVPNAPSGAPPCLAWVGAKADDIGPLAKAREAALAEAEDEYRRLLYVAMTRAKEHLIVCGVGGRSNEGCWYDLVREAFDGDPNFLAEDAEADGEKVWRYRKIPETKSPDARPDSTKKPVGEPNWLRLNISDLTRQQRSIRPSHVDDDGDTDEARTHSARGREDALRRGRIVHRLLQSLPDVPSERRADVARDYLTRAELSGSDVDALQSKVMAILTEPRFAPLFAPGSRPEVPIIGSVTLGREIYRVAGQIDRLAIAEGTVLIGDYKTGLPPARAEDAAGYIRQLSLYRAVLRKIYPAHRIRAGIIWIEAPALVELSDESLDLALNRFTVA